MHRAVVCAGCCCVCVQGAVVCVRRVLLCVCVHGADVCVHVADVCVCAHVLMCADANVCRCREV